MHLPRFLTHAPWLVVLAVAGQVPEQHPGPSLVAIRGTDPAQSGIDRSERAPCIAINCAPILTHDDGHEENAGLRPMLHALPPNCH